VLVGAPIDDVESAADNAVTLEKYGAVYKCNPKDSACTVIAIDNTRKNENYILQFIFEKKKKHR